MSLKQQFTDQITVVYREAFAETCKEFQASIKESLENYHKICNEATAEYEMVQLPALQQYQKLLSMPTELRDAVKAVELEKYEAIQLPAFEIYRSKIRKADEEFSKVLDPARKIIKDKREALTNEWLLYLKVVRNFGKVKSRLDNLVSSQPEKPESVYHRAKTDEEIFAYRAGAFDGAVELARQTLQQLQL